MNKGELNAQFIRYCLGRRFFSMKSLEAKEKSNNFESTYIQVRFLFHECIDMDSVHRDQLYHTLFDPFCCCLLLIYFLSNTFRYSHSLRSLLLVYCFFLRLLLRFFSVSIQEFKMIKYA